MMIIIQLEAKPARSVLNARAVRAWPKEAAMNFYWKLLAAMAGLGLLATVTNPAVAQRKYDPGASDTEIKVGNIMPYSGPLSAYSVIGKTLAAYFNKVNVEGGINGRRITFISYDDSYSPPKTVEQARRLVESDGVLFIFSSFGAATNAAIQKYMNTNKIPQLFVSSGATKWADPKNFPWTIGFYPAFQSEGRVYAKYLIANHPDAKIGVLYQNDDYGKDYVKGLKDGLAGKLPIIAEAPYDVSDTTIDSQIISLKASGADVLYDITTAKFAALAIRKTADLQWKPMHMLNSVSSWVGSVLKPAGFDNAKGILSTAYLKDPTDATWKEDPDFRQWLGFMEKYYPEGDRADGNTVYSYVLAQTLVQVLKQCGDELTRENVMKQAANLKDFEIGMLIPGIKVNTGPTDYHPIKQMQMQRFNGVRWELFGPVLSGDLGG
jgi:branched-chain amino acid transport system substrate-binding protein